MPQQQGPLDLRPLEDALAAEARLDAITPPVNEGLARWVMTDGLRLLRSADAAPVVTAEAGERRYDLYLVEATLSQSSAEYGLVRLVTRLDKWRAGEIEDITQAEVMLQPFDEDDLDAPPPADDEMARAAAAAWRAAMEEFLPRIAGRNDGALMLFDLFPAGMPLSLMALWCRQGPPGEAPPPRAPLVVDEARVAAAARRVRRLGEQETEALRAKVDRQILAATAIDSWIVLFCPFHRTDGTTFEEDRIVVLPETGEPLAIAMNDPWNGHVMPIDGDADVLRGFARFWQEVLIQSGLDVEFVLPRNDEDEDDEDDDEDNDEDQDDGAPPPGLTRLSAWLSFPHPSQGEPRLPVIDRRLQEDHVDFVAPFSFWEHGPFAMPPEARERYRRGIETHYHALIRAVIDPDFPRSPQGGQR